MSDSIYINNPAIIFAFLIEASFIFIYSFINIKYYNGKLSTILIGIGGFFCSVFLEGVIISLIASIFGNDSSLLIFLSLLFPGLFEETGRYICFKYFIKNDKDKIESISYGIGHGGIESFMIGAALLQFIFAKDILIEKGVLKQDMTFGPIFMGVIERFVCVFLQISFSVLVYKAYKDNNIRYYLLAIFFHDFVDFFAFLYQRKILENIYVVELIICLITLLFSRFAYKLYINLEREKVDNNEKQVKEEIPLADKRESED